MAFEHCRELPNVPASLLSPAHQPYLSPNAVIQRNWATGGYRPDIYTRRHLAALAPYLLASPPSVPLLGPAGCKLAPVVSSLRDAALAEAVELHTLRALGPGALGYAPWGRWAYLHQRVLGRFAPDPRGLRGPGEPVLAYVVRAQGQRGGAGCGVASF